MFPARQEHRRLERDAACYPIRGQVVRCVAPNLNAVYLAELTGGGGGGGGGFSCYAIPRGDVAVLGGTHDEEQWDETPDEQTAAGILDRVRAMLPQGAMVRGPEGVGCRV